MTDEHTEPTPRPKRRWFRAIAISTVLFVGGTLFGAMLAVGGMHHAGFHGPGGPQGPSPDRVTHMLNRRLDLSEEQRTQVHAIFTKQDEALKLIRQETAPRVLTVLDETQEAVSQVLDTAQAERWNRDFTRLRNRLQPRNWQEHKWRSGERDRHSRHDGSVHDRPRINSEFGGGPKVAATRVFDRVDANRDGVIDDQEWEQHLMRMLRDDLQRDDESTPPVTDQEAPSL